jgi:hypothetical protein
VFQNRVLRRIFGLKRKDVTGEWRKLHNEVHNLYSSPNTIRVKKIKHEMSGAYQKEKQNLVRIITIWKTQV